MMPKTSQAELEAKTIGAPSAAEQTPLRPLPPPRPEVRGKFLFVGDQKLYLRGVAYGTFRPGEHGEYGDESAFERDFERMAAAGLNAVRTYTVPPRWLLDLAERHGLYVMVGVPWEQHVAFLDDPGRVDSIEQRVREAVRACAGHPAILCYSIGNEIPTPIVRRSEEHTSELQSQSNLV